MTKHTVSIRKKIEVVRIRSNHVFGIGRAINPRAIQHKRSFNYLLSLFLLACLPLIYAPESRAQNSGAEKIAVEAFYKLEEEPYESAVLETAWKDIQKAQALDPNQPWSYIALSRIHLATGFRYGGRFALSSYSLEDLEKARKHAEHAVRLSPSLSMAISNLARVQIILNDRKEAWAGLKTANEADPKSFYPWYLRAVMERAAPERAKTSLQTAERLASRTYQRRFVFDEHATLALRQKDIETAERYYKKIVEIEPTRAHSYGNYGWFLLRWAQRHDDAIVQLEKAVAISPYPAAIADLGRAKLLRDAAK